MDEDTKKALEIISKTVKTIEDQNKKLSDLGVLTEKLEADSKKQISELDDVKKKLVTRNVGVTGAPETTVKKFLGDLVKGKLTGDWSHADETLEYLGQNNKALNRENYSAKDIINSMNGTQAGAVLPVEVRSMVVEAARAKSRLFQLGASNPSFAGLSIVKIPKELTIPTPGTVAEKGAIPVSNNTFGVETFSPKKLGFIATMTEDFLRQGGEFISSYIQGKASTDMANKMEALAINGTGTNNEPLGLLNRTDLTTSSVSLGANGGRYTWADLSRQQDDIEAANRKEEGSSAGYLTHPRVTAGLKRQSATQGIAGATDANSMPIGAYSGMLIINPKKIEELVGYKYAHTTLVPSNLKKGTVSTTAPVIFSGAWESLWLAMWGELEVEISKVATVGNVNAFENYYAYARFTQMWDVGVLKPDAFTIAYGALTTGF